MEINHLTEEQVKQMVSLQNDLNISTNGKDWRSGFTDKGRKIDWDTCLLTESAELIDSFNWKHWKDIDSTDDIENAKIEVVDLWHFLMSKGLLEFDIDNFSTYIYEYTENSIIYNELDYITNVKDFMKVIVNGGEFDYVILESFFRLVYLLPDFTMKDVYKLYIAKHTLNKFRQDYGYASGSYNKTWTYKNKRVEDNVVMVDIIKNMKVDDEFPMHLYMALKDTYQMFYIEPKAANDISIKGNNNKVEIK